MHCLGPDACKQREQQKQQVSPHAPGLRAESCSPSRGAPKLLSAHSLYRGRFYTGSVSAQQIGERYREDWRALGTLWGLLEFSRVRGAGEHHCLCLDPPPQGGWRLYPGALAYLQGRCSAFLDNQNSRKKKELFKNEDSLRDHTEIKIKILKKRDHTELTSSAQTFTL